MNIYFTTEPINRLQNCILNARSFFVFDVQEFITNLHINPAKPANIYFINNEIVNNINSASKLKKYSGIIYINVNLSENLYNSMKIKFGNNPNIDKFILLDNGNINKLKDLYSIFDEVIFFDRFKKTKIAEPNPNLDGPLIDFKTDNIEKFLVNI